MNGVLVLSMDSGMLLWHAAYSPFFGLSSPCDPYQQSGFLYALYSSASAQFGSQQADEMTTAESGRDCLPPLQWYTQDHVVWHFHEVSVCPPQAEPNSVRGSSSKEIELSGGNGNGSGSGGKARRVLTALSTSEAVSPATAQDIAAKVAQVFMREAHATLSANESLKQSKIKQLDKEILTAVTESIHNSFFLQRVSMHFPADIQACFFGSPPAADVKKQNSKKISESNTLSADKKLLKICAEWKTICNSAQIPSVEEAKSLSGFPTKPTHPPPASSETIFPPLLAAAPPKSTGIFSSVKNLFVKNKSNSSSANNIQTNKTEESKIAAAVVPSPAHRWHCFDVTASSTTILSQPSGAVLTSLIHKCLHALEEKYVGHQEMGKLPLLQESLCRSGLQIEFTCRYGTDDLLKALQEAAEGWSGREDTYRVSFCNSGQRQHVSSIAVFPVQLEGERHEGTPSTCHFMEYFEIAGISVIFVKAPNGEEVKGTRAPIADLILRDCPMGNALREYVALFHLLH